MRYAISTDSENKKYYPHNYRHILGYNIIIFKMFKYYSFRRYLVFCPLLVGQKRQKNVKKHQNLLSKGLIYPEREISEHFKLLYMLA